ncbi:MAG: preprotein translocase subunit SecG [Planctomycetes bacterium]|nr:preprotein translocase subunit SecG [Planctomycetota bacterium]
MNTAFLIVTIAFMLVSLAMVLIILVQRPSGGGLAGAFGGAGGSGSDTVFGGRVGDALTWATVIAFVLYLGFAIALNLLDEVGPSVTTTTNTGTSTQTPAGDSGIVPVLDDDLGVILGGDDFGGIDDFDLPPAKDPVDDGNDDSADDEVDTTTKDPSDPPDSLETPNPPGGDN